MAVSVLDLLVERFEPRSVERRKAKATASLERRFESITVDLFARWEQAFYRLISFAGQLAEAEALARFSTFTDEQWERAMAVGNYDAQAFELAGEAMVAGASGVAADFGLPDAFALPNPKAVAYLDDYGAKLVAGISTSTRDDMRRILTSARAGGWGYDKLARELQAKWGSLRVSRPQQHIRSRAHMIAVTETAAAYEQGNLHTYRKMQSAGLAMEYSWLAAGDSRICSICDGLASNGWRPSGEWTEFPPAHPACRCSLNARVISSSKPALDAMQRDGFANAPGSITFPDDAVGQWAGGELRRLGYNAELLSKSDAIRILRRQGWKSGQIVKGLRVTHSQIHGALKSGRLPPPIRGPGPIRKPPLPKPEPIVTRKLSTDELRGKVKEMLDAGESAREIMAKLDITINQVRYYARTIRAARVDPRIGAARTARAPIRRTARAPKDPYARKGDHPRPTDPALAKVYDQARIMRHELELRTGLKSRWKGKVDTTTTDRAVATFGDEVVATGKFKDYDPGGPYSHLQPVTRTEGVLRINHKYYDGYDDVLRAETVLHEMMHSMSNHGYKYYKYKGWEEGIAEQFMRHVRLDELAKINPALAPGGPNTVGRTWVQRNRDNAHPYNKYNNALEEMRDYLGMSAHTYYTKLLSLKVQSRPATVRRWAESVFAENPAMLREFKREFRAWNQILRSDI